MRKTSIGVAGGIAALLWPVLSQAMMVSHIRPTYPIGSISNFDLKGCTDVSEPCRFFGIGHVYWLTDDASNSENCTGTPIGPRTILSAAHCFDGPDSGGAVDARALSSTRFMIPGVLGPMAGTPASYPGYSGAVADPRDIAIVVLDQPLPSWIPKFKLSNFTVMPTGAVVTDVGYGATGTGLTGVRVADAFIRNNFNIVRNSVDAVSGDGARFVQDFDGNGINRMGSSELRTYTGKGDPPYLYDEGLTAFGDSGGPTFYNPAMDLFYRPLPVVPPPGKYPDEYYIVGVASYATDVNRNGRYSEYGDTSGAVFVGKYLDWIASVSPDPVAPFATNFNHAIELSAPDPGGITSSDEPGGTPAIEPDADGDFVVDAVDNCPDTPNIEQQDIDADGIGDACQVRRAQSVEQQACIKVVSKSASSIASAQGAVVLECLKAAVAQKASSLGIPPQEQSVQACPSNDIRAVVSVAVDRALRTEAARCLARPSQRPDFAYTQATASAASAASIELAADMFGTPLDAAFSATMGDAVTQRCQLEVYRYGQKLVGELWRRATGAKATALRGTAAVPAAPTATALQQLVFEQLTTDADGKVSRAEGVLRRKVTAACRTFPVPPSSSFPGECSLATSGDELAACAIARSRCRFCQALNESDGLSGDCDRFDDGSINATCA